VIDGFRRRVDAGEVLTADESQRLIVALDDARRAATTPTSTSYASLAASRTSTGGLLSTRR